MSVIIDGSAGVTTNTGAVYNSIQSATAQASTSGTSIDFTSIPSWVKRITVMLTGVSTSGTSNYQIQLGAGSVTTSGYLCTYSNLGTSTISTATVTSGFTCQIPPANTDTASGTVVFTNITGNTWVANGLVATTTGTRLVATSGNIVLSGTLDRVRITTTTGTDTFDAGSINILYE